MNKKYFLLRSFPSSSLGMQPWKLQLPVQCGFREAGASGSWVPKLELGNQWSNGFTLVEMTVVLLLITLLASVAVRETAELGFQTRYEQTKERLDMIKQAILGNPKQIINGQQAVSGFVADMGRLPYMLRELIDDYDCDGPLVDGNSDTNFTNDGGCPWTLDSTYNSGLGSGWRGPYLAVSDDPASPDAFTDGWGRTSTDSNYGWNFFDLSMLTLNSSDTNNLIIQSLGKDQSSDQLLPPVNPESYDNDYPANIYPSGSVSCPPCYPIPAVRQQDWQVDVSNGISVSFIKLNRALPVSLCTDTTKTTKATCLPPETWYGGCDKAGYFNKGSCTAPAVAGTWNACSDGSSTKAVCEKPAGIWNSGTSTCSDGSTTQPVCEKSAGNWYGEGFGCSDQSKSNKTLCSSPSLWRSCTDDGTIISQSACSAANQIWYGDDLFSISTIPIQPLPPTIPICMKVFYRTSHSTIEILLSDEDITNDTSTVHFDPKSILADGSFQTLRFTNFRDSTSTNAIPDIPMNIPIGSNAIGIYQYDGTDCKTSNILYPINHLNPIQVDFQPHTTLPVINW